MNAPVIVMSTSFSFSRLVLVSFGLPLARFKGPPTRAARKSGCYPLAALVVILMATLKQGQVPIATKAEISATLLCMSSSTMASLEEIMSYAHSPPSPRHFISCAGQNIKRDEGPKVQLQNIAAAKAVADVIRTSLGPRAMLKMLLDPMGGIVLTNDGNAILREIDVSHPAAKAMVEISRTQDEEVGDGTTSVIILGACDSLAERQALLWRWRACPSRSRGGETAYTVI